VIPIQLPDGFRLERLRQDHPRRPFRSGEPLVDQWLATKALQHQTKRLSVTKVLVEVGKVVGYYTLATGQVDFSELPEELSRHLPRRTVPVAVLAWLGVDLGHQRQGWGERLLALALRDCWEAGEVFSFVAVILDCLSETAKAFYHRWGFAELPNHPSRLYLSAKHLDVIIHRK
jgi:GNAT superfamily N-acetyltransferase